MYERLSNLFKEHTKVSQQLDFLRSESKNEEINKTALELVSKGALKDVMVLYGRISNVEIKKSVEEYIVYRLECCIEKNEIQMIKTIYKGIPIGSQLHVQLKNRINEYLLSMKTKIDSSLHFIKISYDLNTDLATNVLFAFFNTFNECLLEMDSWIKECNDIISMLHHKKYELILCTRLFKYSSNVLSSKEVTIKSECAIDEYARTGNKNNITSKAENVMTSRKSQNLFVLKSIYKERELKYFSGCLSGALIKNCRGRDELKYLINKIAKRSMSINVMIKDEMKNMIKELALENEKEFIFLL
ncbi:hypothetical protein THOM_1703 [Trachipleistophora hominis]|uniref:Uncharacterized protein n=1 Tax=Trachipleistophora hominis TaxID=72359 RepID=L7JX56_TRAHO|nr:hypothetical protein THOM_1703 [Trachipleistophora hominis]